MSTMERLLDVHAHLRRMCRRFVKKNSTAIKSSKRIRGLLKKNNDDANNSKIATELLLIKYQGIIINNAV